MLIIIILLIFHYILANNLRNNTNRQLNENKIEINQYHYDFPDEIEIYHRRKDIYTGLPVMRGRLELYEQYLLSNKTITYQELHRILQCPLVEPGLNGLRGSISLHKILPPNRNILKLAAIKLESDCGKWRDCQKILRQYENGSIEPNLNNKLTSPYQVRLIRIVNNTFYYDWPWKRERFDDQVHNNMLLQKFISTISDLPDSVFFQGEEWHATDSKFPFPITSDSPSFKSMDIPKPWIKAFNDEIELYNRAFHPSSQDINEYKTFINGHNLNIHCPRESTTIKHEFNNATMNIINKNQLNEECSYPDKAYHKYHSKNFDDWKKRNPKLGFFGGITNNRHIIYDLANIYPDLIDAKWHSNIDGVNPWNPLSTEESGDLNKPIDPSNHSFVNYTNLSLNERLNLTKVGYLESLYSLHEGGINFYNRMYKYLLILLGQDGNASADRLAYILAHSGAVPFLQVNEFEYHFSNRLKPWVHYVPISYNIADVVDKIMWLRNHEHAAYRIALNAKAFGESYLRVEDYYCYYATFYMTLGQLLNGSDALIPFDMKKLP